MCHFFDFLIIFSSPSSSSSSTSSSSSSSFARLPTIKGPDAESISILLSSAARDQTFSPRFPFAPNAIYGTSGILAWNRLQRLSGTRISPVQRIHALTNARTDARAARDGAVRVRTPLSPNAVDRTGVGGTLSRLFRWSFERERENCDV